MVANLLEDRMSRNILQIVESKVSGGAETVMLEQAKALSGSGWRVTVMMPHPPSPATNCTNYENIEYLAFDFIEQGILKSIIFLRAQIKRNNIRVIHTHNFLSAVLSVFATLGRKNVKLITTIHTDYRKIKDGNMFFAIRTYLSMFVSYHQCFRVIAVSKEIKRITKRYFFVPSEKITVVENGVDPDKMIIDIAKVTELNAKYKKTIDSFILINIGTIYKLKGQRLLIEAIGKYMKDLKIICLFIGPEGDHFSMEEVKKEIKRWSIEDKVFFPGYQKDVQNWLKIGDVYVHPSINEAMPLSVIEAMYMGLTPIVFDLPAYEGLVVNGSNGIIVNQNDPHQLANAIRSVYENRKELQKMGAAAQRHILKTYMLNFAIDKIEALLRE